MIRTILVLILSFSLSINIIAQNNNAGKEVNEGLIQWHGFIKTDFWYDSRKIAGAREDLFLLYPLNKIPDINGQDTNNHSSFNFSAITSRINATIKGPDALNAKTSAFIEADFSGISNNDINGFRLRHAYLTLNWEKTELLLGQYWHPMFVTEVFPTVVSLNTGAPFQPFIRNPQIRFSYSFGKVKFIAALLSQLDYVNDGPEGKSPQYIRNAGIPNIHTQLQYKNGAATLGLAFDYKIIQPMAVTDSNMVTDEKLSSRAFMAYYKFQKNKWTIKSKAILGQNLTEHLLLGGYAVKKVDSTSGRYSFTPLEHAHIWLNLLYGYKLKGGLFLGYAKNLGSKSSNMGMYFARGADIEYVYRISPSVSYSKGKTKWCAELEYTGAAYGKPDEMGIFNQSEEVANLRFIITIFYFF